MSVSMSIQFSGNVEGTRHRAVIAGMLAAMQAVLVAEGVNATFSAYESESISRGRSFPDGTFGDFNTQYPSRVVTVSTGFHVNEEPVPAPAPVESPAEAVAPATPAETAPAQSDTAVESSSASAPSVESAPSESTPVETPAETPATEETAPAPAEMAAPESSDGTGTTQA